MTASTSRYGATAMALHWVLGAAIVAALCVGWYMTGLPFSPQRLKLYNWHKWAAVRLLWRLTHRPPALPAAVQAAMPRWQQVAHHGTHHALYALFLIVPLVGWAYSSAAGFPIVFLGLVQLPDFVPVNKELAEAIKPWHAVFAYALAVLVLLHVAAALKHQFIDRDGLIGRMWPGRG
jgi:cytochrome b561